MNGLPVYIVNLQEQGIVSSVYNGMLQIQLFSTGRMILETISNVRVLH